MQTRLAWVAGGSKGQGNKPHICRGSSAHVHTLTAAAKSLAWSPAIALHRFTDQSAFKISPSPLLPQLTPPPLLPPAPTAVLPTACCTMCRSEEQGASS